MDKQGRITRLDEWKENTTVRWVKGGVEGDAFLVCEITLGGCVLLAVRPDGPAVWFYPEQWRNRFKVIANGELTGTDKAKKQ